MFVAENKDNIIKLIPTVSKDIKVNNHLINIIELTNSKCLLAMIINEDDEVELVTKSVFEHLIDNAGGLHISLDNLEAMSLELVNLVAVLKVNKLIK